MKCPETPAVCPEWGEMGPPPPLRAANDVLAYLTAERAAYTQRHQRSGNQHEQFLIEFHGSQLEHAIELMEEVRDMVAAEFLWEGPNAP